MGIKYHISLIKRLMNDPYCCGPILEGRLFERGLGAYHKFQNGKEQFEKVTTNGKPVNKNGQNGDQNWPKLLSKQAEYKR